MSHRRLGAALIAACVVLPLAVPAPASAGTSSRDVKVMTRNLYLGADLIPLATQPSREAFEQAAAQRFQTVLNNDYATRARALAGEIARHKPDLIGLQEAAVWRRGPDGVKDGNATKSTQVVYDSVAVLQAELKKRNMSYRVANIRPWFDYEAPTALNYDVRLTQQDAILVRTGKGARVRAGNPFKGGFRDTFDPDTQVGKAKQARGWVGVDARLGSRRFRFVTTHLEAYSPEIADKQMKQLLAGPLKSKRRQAVLMGDFNSDPKTGASDERGAERAPNAYRTAIDAGFFNPLPRRETCCFAEDLHSTAEKLDSWIDHIVVRPRVRVVRSSILGSRSSERVSGLWPSDHAGIAATLRLK
jgi:endonuclease/exonuclease/phosphatase family metal-dependent hydrolase